MPPTQTLQQNEIFREQAPLSPPSSVQSRTSSPSSLVSKSPASSSPDSLGMKSSLRSLSPSPSPLPLSSPPPPPPPTFSLPRAVIVSLALASLILLQSMNMSMLTTIQGSVADALDSHSQTSWFTSAYLIPMSALGPLNGKLCTIFRPRACILYSAAIFALGSVVTAYAGTLEGFLVGRAMAGTGAAGIFTVSITVVLDLSGEKRRGVAIGLLNSCYTLGVALGAAAAGYLEPRVGWRALFGGQAPICLVAGLVLFLSIPDRAAATSSAKGRSLSVDSETSPSTFDRLRGLDHLGAITLTLTLTLVLFALSSPTTIPISPLLAAAFALAAFIAIENSPRLAPDPLIPLSLLASRGLLLSCLSTVGFMCARWSVLFYSPTYALALRGWAPTAAGAILVPTNLGFALGGLVVGAVHIRRAGSFYLATLVTYAIFPVTLAVLAALVGADPEQWGPKWYVAAVAACGLVTGSALNYTLAHVLHLTPPDTHYVASALIATFRGFAGSFGSAVGGGLFARTLRRGLEDGFAERGMVREDLVKRLLGSPALVRQLAGEEKKVAMEGYEQALRTLFVASMVLAVAMVFVQAGTGWKGPGDKQIDSERRPLLADDDDM